MRQGFLRDILPCLLIAAGLLLGGSSSGGIWANFTLQAMSLCAIAIVLLRERPVALSPGLKGLTIAVLALPVLQLLPLPPGLWAALPGRGGIAQGFDLAGLARPWLPLSLDQDGTLSVLVALLPPLAMLLIAAQASVRGHRLALWTVLAVALGSVLLGLLQSRPGFGPSLQPYALTNPGMATGLFANRNHLATLLLLTLPCAVLLVPGRMAQMLVGAVLTGGVLLTGSDAGAMLVLPVLAACLLYVRPLWRPGKGGLLLLGLIALCLALVAGLQAWRFTQMPPAGGAEQHRPMIIATTLHAARDYLPSGSGGGTFQRIYPRYEDPAKADPEYRNHAHSDYAELVLEYGLPGLILSLATVAWWLRGSIAARSADARAGAVILGVVLVHSLGDYPLRTAGIAMLAALAAALLDRHPETAEPSPQTGPDRLQVAL